MKLTHNRIFSILSIDSELVKPKDINDAIQMIDGSAESTSSQHIILDFREAGRIQRVSVPFFCKAASFFEQKNQKFSLIGGDSFKKIFEAEGLVKLFDIYPTLDSFYDKNSIVSTGDYVKKFLNTLIESTVHTLQVTLGTKIQTQPPQVIRPEARTPTLQVGATAGIVSPHFNGNLMLCFSEEVFLKTMSLFLQSEVTKINPDIRDGGAELLNIIIGQTKMKLNEEGFDIKQIIPNIVTGNAVDVSPAKNQISLLIPLEAHFGNFFLVLHTKDNSEYIMKIAS